MKSPYASRIHRLILIMAFGLLAQAAYAVPMLQVDINGGTYIGVHPNQAINESTTIAANTFTVDAIFTGRPSSPNPNGLFYLVLGVTDLAGNAVSSFGAGSINIDGTNYFNSDFTVGLVPYSNSPYGPYPTLNMPLAFSFGSATAIASYDVESELGDPVPDVDGGSLLTAFNVDRTSLGGDYLLVFDLVASDGSMNPRSHNAVSFPGDPYDPDDPEDPVVPEPATVALVALGLGGLAARRWRNR